MENLHLIVVLLPLRDCWNIEEATVIHTHKNGRDSIVKLVSKVKKNACISDSNDVFYSRRIISHLFDYFYRSLFSSILYLIRMSVQYIYVDMCGMIFMGAPFWLWESDSYERFFIYILIYGLGSRVTWFDKFIKRAVWQMSLFKMNLNFLSFYSVVTTFPRKTIICVCSFSLIFTVYN